MSGVAPEKSSGQARSVSRLASSRRMSRSVTGSSCRIGLSRSIAAPDGRASCSVLTGPATSMKPPPLSAHCLNSLICSSLNCVQSGSNATITSYSLRS